MKANYHIIGHTNPYLAKFTPFNGNTTIVLESYYDLDNAKKDLLQWAVEESDNNSYNDDFSNVINQNGEEMIFGELGGYEYDGRYYSIITHEELINQYSELYKQLDEFYK